MKIIIQVIVSIILLFPSCKQREDCCVVIDTAINILFVDQKGDNIFTVDSTGLVITNDISIDYVVAGEKERARNAFFFYTDYGYPVMSLFPNDIDYNGETLVNLGSLGTDTVRTEMKRGENYTICTKVRYNGQLVFDVSSPTEEQIEKGRFIKVVKNIPDSE
ncbi:MAG: hypothetical protein FWF54_09650 [Candidatus Azobacteroides sp.]|nr:hypothetical protein [Candidatus Azobacteroides sp.]